MPAIWSSSERPISVRTVWVDGVRHAILTSDDPLLNIKNHRRPQTAIKQRSYPVKYVCRENLRSQESLDSCFVNLHVVIDKKDSIKELGKIHRRQSAPVNRNSRTSLNIELNGILKTSKNNQSFDDTKNQFDGSSATSKYFLISKKNSIEQSDSECHNQIDDEFSKNAVKFSDNFEDNLLNQEINSNPLSERVLQWMDMSGRVTTYIEKTEINVNQKLNPIKAKVCSFRRKNLSPPQKEITQQFKLTLTKEPLKCELDHMNNNECINKPKKNAQKLFKNEANDNVISQNQEPIWSQLGRPQLHIFMPDLNSSGEDISSQDSLISEEEVSSQSDSDDDDNSFN